MMNLSKAPFIPYDPTNPQHTTSAFSPGISSKVRKFFAKESLPSVTDETPHMLLDTMQAVFERDGANPALVIPETRAIKDWLAMRRKKPA